MMDLTRPEDLFDPSTELDDPITAPASDLDDIVSEFAGPARKREPILEPIPNRPGWSLLLDVDQSDTDRRLVAAKSKPMAAAIDAKNPEQLIVEMVRSAAFQLGLACQEICRNDVVVTDLMLGGKTDEPATFRHPSTHRLLKVKTMTEAVIGFLGSEVVLAISEKLDLARQQWALEEGEHSPRV